MTKAAHAARFYGKAEIRNMARNDVQSADGYAKRIARRVQTYLERGDSLPEIREALYRDLETFAGTACVHDIHRYLSTIEIALSVI